MKIKQNYEYAILTNEIYQSWSGMKASEYKDYKNIRVVKDDLEKILGKSVISNKNTLSYKYIDSSKTDKNKLFKGKDNKV